jgi:hypothetical protein
MSHRSYYSSVAVKSILYDADGNEVDDEALAVRGVTVEVGDDGEVVAELESWEVDPKELDGDVGGLATRPRDEDS